MAELKLNISDPKTGKTYKKVVDTDLFTGRKIGDKIPGNLLDLEGYELQIKGGSDNAGFPMRRDMDGQGRKTPLLSKGPGVKIKRHGMLKRKTVRANTFSALSAQVNMQVITHGKIALDEVFPPTEKKEAPA